MLSGHMLLQCFENTEHIGLRAYRTLMLKQSTECLLDMFAIKPYLVFLLIQLQFTSFQSLECADIVSEVNLETND